MKHPKLKPCPFCGGMATIQQDTRYPDKPIKAYEPICINPECVIYKADNVYYKSEKSAVVAWNTRAKFDE